MPQPHLAQVDFVVALPTARRVAKGPAIKLPVGLALLTSLLLAGSLPAAVAGDAGRGHARPAPYALTAGVCSRRVAQRLQQTLPAWRSAKNFRNPGQVICYDFTGDGRRDLVFTVWAYMNHGAHYWAAFQATPSGWARSAYRSDCCGRDKRFGGLGIAISRSGNELVIEQPAYAADDPLCCPSQGTRTGIWKWRRSGRLSLVEKHRDKSASASAVRDCNTWASYPNVKISSARNMTCSAAKKEMRRYQGSIARYFRTPGGFACSRVSGGDLGGQWRCVRGAQAFRFEFGD
jgi:hypothetical protein